MKKATDSGALAKQGTPATAPAPTPVLPTHGGLYEADPNTQALRALEGGPPEEKPAQTPDATTGEQA